MNPLATRTLTALFLKKSDAKKAKEGLKKAGVLPENIAVGEASVIERFEVEERDGFFKRLFTKHPHVPHAHRTHYEQHVRDGATLITAAVDESQVDAVVDMLNYYGAKDFSGEYLKPLASPRAAESRHAFVDETPQPLPDAEHRSQASRDLRREPEPEPVIDAPEARAISEEEGVDELNSDIPEVEDVESDSSLKQGKGADGGRDVPFGEQPGDATREEEDSVFEEHPEHDSRSERRGGVRVYHGIHTSQWSERELDRDFEEHHQQHYGESGSYAQYSAAYRYGAKAANDPANRERDFDTVENDLKHDFEAKGVADEWARVREAVKFGFDRGRQNESDEADRQSHEVGADVKDVG